VTSTRSAVVSLIATVWLFSGCAPPFRSPPYLVQNDTGTVLNGVRVPIRCPGLLPVHADSTNSEAIHDVPISASLAGSQVGIPGWNDCQRLVQGAGNGSYGPLVGIFANENLDSITRQQFEQPGGMPVAQLYNFSSLRYPILNLEPRYSCLYLRMDSGGVWLAHLSWMDDVNACPELTSWPGGGPPLNVLASSPTPGAPHPAVARWDWDTNRNRNYMAVTCLDEWCEIGAPPLNPSPPLGPVRTAPRKAAYDEQTLAVPDHANKNWPRVKASIVPQPGMDTLETGDFTCPDPCLDDAGWVHMATVTLAASGTNHYETKMGFTRGSNQIYVRRKTRPGQAVWQTRIVSAANDTTYRRTLYVSHRDDVPATARWRWKEDDELSWTRCLPGCCETSNKAIQPSDW
jgi:hypothetical protein